MNEIEKTLTIWQMLVIGLVGGIIGSVLVHLVDLFWKHTKHWWGDHHKLKKK